MNYIQAAIMGLIQGLTEFLPVSSSGHLVLGSSLYSVLTRTDLMVGTGEEVFFDIVLHVGTLIAVLIYFKDDIVKIIKDFFVALKTKDFSSPEAKLSLFIILGTFVTAVIAYPLKGFCETLVYSPAIVGGLLLVTGTVLFLSEIVSRRIENKKSEINLKTAVLIAIAQGLAAFPGISRSGSTIATGLFMGLDKITCARYSFLLSVPIIIAASVFYPILELDFGHMAAYDWGGIATGFFVALFSGYFCIKYFLKFLQKYSLKVFSVYCFIVGIFMITFFGFIVK